MSVAHRHDHITTVLTTLRWLPVRKRALFKTVVLVWKYLNSTAPGYLSSCCLCFRSSASQVSLDGPTTSSQGQTTIGRRSFAVAEPSLWDSFPTALRRPEMTLHTFKRQLKAYLFDM